MQFYNEISKANCCIQERRTKLKRKIVVGAIVALCFATGMRASAVEQKMNGRGNLAGMIQFFSQDILYLESEISNLMAECGKELNE